MVADSNACLRALSSGIGHSRCFIHARAMSADPIQRSTCAVPAGIAASFGGASCASSTEPLLTPPCSGASTKEPWQSETASPGREAGHLSSSEEDNRDCAAAAGSLRFGPPSLSVQCRDRLHVLGHSPHGGRGQRERRVAGARCSWYLQAAPDWHFQLARRWSG